MMAAGDVPSERALQKGGGITATDHRRSLANPHVQDGLKAKIFALIAVAGMLLGGLVSSSDTASAQEVRAGAGATPLFEVVGIKQGAGIVTSGVVVGHESGKLAVLVMKQPIDGLATTDGLQVSRAGGGANAQPYDVVAFQQLDFTAALQPRKLAAIAEAAGISRAVAQERLAGADGEEMLLILARGPVNTETLKLEYTNSECAAADSKEILYYFQKDGIARPVPWLAAERATTSAPNGGARGGGIIASLCDGANRAKAIAIETVLEDRSVELQRQELAPVIDAVSLLMIKERPDLDVRAKLVGPSYASECSRHLGASRIVRTTDTLDGGQISARLLDIPYLPNERVSVLSEKTLERVLDDPTWIAWGRNGRSPEFYVFRIDDSDKFVFDRYCKSNMALRGRLIGQAAFEGAEDAGVEFADGSFYLAITETKAIYASSRMRHAVLIKSIPGIYNVRKVEVSGRQFLIGLSNQTRAIHLVELTEELTGRMGATTNNQAGIPYADAGAAVDLNWVKLDFSQISWASGSDAGLQLHAHGGNAVLIGHDGIALIELKSGIPVVTRSIARKLNGDGPANELSSALRTGNYSLLGSSIVDIPKSRNFAVLSVYGTPAPTGASKEVLVIAIMRIGQPWKVVTLDLGNRNRSWAKAVRDRFYPNDAQRMVDLYPAGIRLVFTAANDQFERFWGAVVVNTSLTFEIDPGTTEQDSLAFGYASYFWFNKFDRIWERREVGGLDKVFNLCKSFDFANLTVIKRRGRPIRLLATVPEGCARQNAQSGMPETSFIPIQDHMSERFRVRRRGAQQQTGGNRAGGQGAANAGQTQ